MSRFVAIPFIGGCYADDARPWTVQDTCNYLPANAEGEGTRSPSLLKTPPGLQDFATAGTKHRGARNVEGKYFVVSGPGLYQVKPNGSVVYLMAIPGTGRVQMSHNQIAGGNEVIIVNGSAGYLWSTVTATGARITDPGYPGAIGVEYIAHLFVQIEPQRRDAFTSALDDGADYNALETFQGESKPDRIVGHIVANGEYVLFNERSMDHFDYIGATNELFRNKQYPIDRGCAAKDSICLLDNATFFIGDDGIPYEKRGFELRRIGKHAIEAEWSHFDLSKAFAFTWEDRGHKVWYVTFPEAGGRTWGYDVATREWHRRQSYGLTRWRLSTLTKWNGAWYGGDYHSGKIFRLAWDYLLESSDPIVAERVGGVGHDNQNQMLVEAIEFVFDTGGPETVAGPVFPLAFDMDQYTVDGVTFGGGLPDYAVGDVVDFWYRTLGGMGAVTFAIDGTLPAGLSFDGGHVTGTCTSAEHDNAWTVQATDETPTSVTLDDESYVLDMVGTPPNSFTSTAYSYALTGSEGEAPYTFTRVSGTLPVGLTLASDGTISGTTDATPATSSFSVRMVDVNGVDVTHAYMVTVGEACHVGGTLVALSSNGWYYKQVDRSDVTNYSGTSDFAGWTANGSTAFGGKDGGPGHPVLVEATVWVTHTRMWIGRTVSGPAGRPYNVRIPATMDDTVNVYWNGVALFTMADGNANLLEKNVTVPGASVTGTDILVVQGVDRTAVGHPGPGEYCYMDVEVTWPYWCEV